MKIPDFIFESEKGHYYFDSSVHFLGFIRSLGDEIGKEKAKAHIYQSKIARRTQRGTPVFIPSENNDGPTLIEWLRNYGVDWKE